MQATSVTNSRVSVVSYSPPRQLTVNPGTLRSRPQFANPPLGAALYPRLPTPETTRVANPNTARGLNPAPRLPHLFANPTPRRILRIACPPLHCAFAYPTPARKCAGRTTSAFRFLTPIETPWLEPRQPGNYRCRHSVRHVGRMGQATRGRNRRYLCDRQSD
jgi:hypothetical protein